MGTLHLSEDSVAFFKKEYVDLIDRMYRKSAQEIMIYKKRDLEKVSNQIAFLPTNLIQEPIPNLS